MPNFVDELLEREKIFRDFHVWPVANRLDVGRWLSNFDEADRELAARLAEGFCYYSDDIFTAMLKSSVQKLSNRLYRGGQPELSTLTECDRVAFVKVEGERPSLADSGYLVSRKIRAFGVTENRILSPRQALGHADRFEMFVFFDDIVGSGSQFMHTWRREHVFGGQRISFQSVADAEHGQFAYCCALATETGVSTIKGAIDKISVHASHILPSSSSLTDRNCSIWRHVDYDTGIAFLRTYGARAGYGEDQEWAGFGSLALRVAFEHGTPDFTLPIFTSTRSGWLPLIRDSQ